MKKSSLRTDAGTISYLSGDQRKNLLLLHSLNLSSSSWKDVFDSLAQNFNIYALDMPGHGDSEKPAKNLLVEDYARTFINFMDKISLDKAVVCGNSVGALIAMEMAASFPQRVEKLILAGCPARDPWERMERLTLASLSFDAQGNPLPLSLTDLGISLAHPTPELLNWFNHERAKAGVWVKKTLIAISLYDFIPKLPFIKCPTLVLFGDKDLLMEKERVLLEGIKGARRAIIPDAGHVPQIDKPQAFLQEVNRFLTAT